MSPRRRSTARRRRNAVIGGVASLVVASATLIGIWTVGGGEDKTPPTAGSSIRLDLQLSRDLGALPARDSWCSGSAHCWIFQQGSGDATDYGDTGGWHLSPVGSPRVGVVSSLPIVDATGWVDYTSELGGRFDGDTVNAFQASSQTSASASAFALTVVFNTTPNALTSQRLFAHRNVTASIDVYVETDGTVRAYLVGDVAVKTITSTNTYDSGAWHCATLTSDGGGTGLALYVDGASDKTGQNGATGDLAVTALPTVGRAQAAAAPLLGGISRVRLEYAAVTLADHQALCGDLWQSPAGGPSNNKPLPADSTWTQTGGARCYPSSATTAICAPGGLVPYTVDATRVGVPVEPDATNRVLYNTAIDCVNWTCVASATAVVGEVAPDGSATASLITVAAGANHVEYDASGYTADASPLHLKMWAKCSSGTLYIHGDNTSARGDWDVDCTTIGGAWTLIDSDHAAVTVTVPFNASAGGAAGVHFDGDMGALSASIWAPTLTEEEGTDLMVIPTAASAVSTGDPVWAIANTVSGAGPYHRTGDTVTQTLTTVSGTCLDLDTTTNDILLTGLEGTTCTGIWYGLQVTK